MTVCPGLGGRTALVHVACTGMLEPCLTRFLILRYLVSTAVSVVCLNISDKCLLTDCTNKVALTGARCCDRGAVFSSCPNNERYTTSCWLAWTEEELGFCSSVIEEHLSPGGHITSWPALSFPNSKPDEIGRWKCRCDFCVLVGSEPQWCWSPLPARSQASLQRCNESTFNFVPIASRLLYILSQSMGVSRTFIRKTTKFHSNTTLCKLGLNSLLFLCCDYEQTPSLGWFLTFKAVFEWEVLNFKIRLNWCLVF